MDAKEKLRGLFCTPHLQRILAPKKAKLGIKSIFTTMYLYFLMLMLVDFLFVKFMLLLLIRGRTNET